MVLAQQLLRFILYLPEFEDAETKRFARSILYIFIIGITCATGMCVYYILYAWWSNVLIITIMLSISFYCLYLLRQAKLEESATIAALTVILALTVSITLDSGIYDPGILVLFPLLVILANFVRKRYLYTLGVALFVWIWILFYLEQTGYYKSHGPIIRPLDLTILTSAIFIFSLAILQVTYQRMNSINKNLLAAKEVAEAASYAKSNFLTVISHELRTPLNAVIGYSEFLIEELTEEEELTVEHLEDLKSIKKSGGNLLGLINNILDLSKIEMGQVDLQLSTFGIIDLVTDVINIVMPMAKQNRTEILLNNDLLADQGRIETDRAKLEQVLLNLLSNAAKFTEDGQITIRLYLDHSNDGPQLCISIEDSGIGIPEESFPIIFEAFQQADSSLSRMHGGTGLGLAIARNLMNLLNGTIVVKSQVDVGSTFVVCLPYPAIRLHPIEVA